MMKLILFAALLGLTAGYCASKANRRMEVIIRPPAKVEVELGGTISIVCAAHGHGSQDPLVYWEKGIGASHKEKGKRLGPTSIGKSVYYVEAAEKDDIDNYRCVIEDCCGGKERIDVEVVVPEATCEDVYGVGHVVFGATWAFRNWTEAVDDCASKGLELAMPKNAAENEELRADLERSFLTHPNAAKFAHENWCWLGASDEEEEDVWRASLDNSILEWYNWDKKQPDNKPAVDETFPESQNVAGIHRGTGKWDDSYKHYKRPYACLCTPQDK